MQEHKSQAFMRNRNKSVTSMIPSKPKVFPTQSLTQYYPSAHIIPSNEKILDKSLDKPFKDPVEYTNRYIIMIKQ